MTVDGKRFKTGNFLNKTTKMVVYLKVWEWPALQKLLVITTIIKTMVIVQNWNKDKRKLLIGTSQKIFWKHAAVLSKTNKQTFKFMNYFLSKLFYLLTHYLKATPRNQRPNLLRWWLYQYFEMAKKQGWSQTFYIILPNFW